MKQQQEHKQYAVCFWAPVLKCVRSAAGRCLRTERWWWRWQEGGWSSDCCRCRWAGTGPEEYLSAASQTHTGTSKDSAACWRPEDETGLQSVTKTLFNMNITQQRNKGKRTVIDRIQKMHKKRMTGESWPWETQFPSGRIWVLQRWRSWLGCILHLKGRWGTAPPERTPSDCSARSRSALRPRGYEDSGTTPEKNHGNPVDKL